MIKLYFLSLFLFLFCNQSVIGQYCTSVGPSSSADSNVESFSIFGESATSINYVGCPGVTGLEDLTATESVSLTAANSYTLNVQFGTCNGNYSGAGEAWIDFNLDGTFDLSESIGTWSGLPPVAPSIFNFTVPPGSSNGVSRMRIMHWEGGSNPLNPCATFSWGSVVDVEVILSGGTGGGGSSYCSGGPSSTADSNVNSAYLLGEGGTEINFTGCPGVAGLNNLTSLQSVDLGKGYSYSMDVLFGTCGGNYSGGGEAWIDYDQNGIFDPTESIGTWSGMPPSATIFNFTVPLGATDGNTRMRIVQQEAATPPLNPCATYTWGSTIDFTVVIGAGVDCSGYIGDDFSDPRPVTSLPYQEDYNNAVCYSNNVPVYQSPDVFYELIMANYSVDYLDISLCGSTFDTYLSVLDKDTNVIAYNDDYGACSPQSQLIIETAGYDTLYVVVQGWGTAKGDYSISINESASVSINKVENYEIEIYPNPANNYVNIKGVNPGTNVTILDLSGKTIMNYKINDNQIIDASELISGIYFIKIELDDQIFMHKLIIE